MLSTIPFFLVVFAPLIFLVLAFFAGMRLADKIFAEPKPPAHVATPEELAASQARVSAMMAQIQESRLEHAHHH